MSRASRRASAAERRRSPASVLRGVGAVVVAAVVGFLGARLLPERAQLSSALRDARAAPDLSRFASEIERAAGAAGVEADLLRGLVAAESGGDPRARSRVGALGLAQLMPATAEEQRRRLGLPSPIDLFDPAVNLRLGASYLAQMLALFSGEEAFAVAAYNAGPEPVKRWRLRALDASPAEVIRREGYAETRRHVERVLRLRDAYRDRR